ncbi:MAG TPA: DNA polymerase IV [Flavobacterium sp.]|nr:DNA polymerase IV [Flavobacterium sp.]
MKRKIIHIDMDAFFASIEQRDHPQFRGKPLAVGYAGARGVVAAASYEARVFGVRSAMPSVTAVQKCPELLFAPPRFQAYKEVSLQIRSIFLEYTDLVEPLSLDEAFLDVTENHKNMTFAMDIAQEIKDKIQTKTNLTASAGVSFNKFLAKIASDYNKPNGMFVITPKRAASFVEGLEIERFFGIGKKTAERMHQMGIFSGYDLKQKSEDFLVEHFGKSGKSYYLNARAIDHREVNPNRTRKSLGTENTFYEDTNVLEVLEKELDILLDDLFRNSKKTNFKGKTLTLKVKYSDFQITSKSKTFADFIVDFELLHTESLELLHQIPREKKIRLLGLSIKNNELNTTEVLDSAKEAIQLKLPFKEV